MSFHFSRIFSASTPLWFCPFRPFFLFAAAQGALAMMGAYFAWIASALIGLPMWVGAPVAGLAMFGVGALIERLAMRRMIGQPLIMAIMLTMGMEIMLRGVMPGFFGASVKKISGIVTRKRGIK